MRASTIDGLCFDEVGGFGDRACCGEATVWLLSRLGLGEFSGDSEGKDVNDLSDIPELGPGVVTEMAEDSLRGFMRTVPDLWLLVEVVDVCEELRCKPLLLLLSIAELQTSLHGNAWATSVLQT